MTRTPIVIEKLAGNDREDVQALYDEGIARAKAMGVPIKKRLFARTFTHIKGDNVNGKVVPRIDRVDMPQRIFPSKKTRALDAWFLNHEMDEVEAFNRGNLRPVHSHMDSSVLTAEPNILSRIPKEQSKKLINMRKEDLDFNVVISGDPQAYDSKGRYVEPAYEKNIKKILDGENVSTAEINKSYTDSNAQGRSTMYNGYIHGMLRRATGKDKEDDTNNAYNIFNDKLHPSLRYNPEKEKETADKIFANAKKSTIKGGAIGGTTGLLLGLSTMPYMPEKIKYIYPASFAASLGGVGAVMGKNYGTTKGIRDNYYHKDGGVSK